MAWRQGCMGSMNMQCELNLYSTFLKKVLFQQLRTRPAHAIVTKITLFRETSVQPLSIFYSA